MGTVVRVNSDTEGPPVRIYDRIAYSPARAIGEPSSTKRWIARYTTARAAGDEQPCRDPLGGFCSCPVTLINPLQIPRHIPNSYGYENVTHPVHRAMSLLR